MASSLPPSTASALVDITYGSFSYYEEFPTIQEVSKQLRISRNALPTTPTSQHSNELRNSTVDNAFVCNSPFQRISSLQCCLQFKTHFLMMNLGFSSALILDSWIAHKPASQNIPQRNRWYISLLK